MLNIDYYALYDLKVEIENSIENQEPVPEDILDSTVSMIDVILREATEKGDFEFPGETNKHYDEVEDDREYSLYNDYDEEY